MDCEVVVVGAGIGGLTVAALLAQRGTDVCVLERESVVGGCAASFEKFGYNFEQGYGLYTSWAANDIHPRIFSELPVDPPEVRLLDPGLVVRLPDGAEVTLASEPEKFEGDLRQSFPECADQAIGYYRQLSEVAATLRSVLQRGPDFFSLSRFRQLPVLLSEGKAGTQILRTRRRSAIAGQATLSPRFCRFLDVQLQTLGQVNSTDASYLYAALALNALRGETYGIRGGAYALASKLEESIIHSGGRIRLNTPVLRLSYDASGLAVGVDLLSGETVRASKAIISNLTLWDTYGKLVGLNRTPTQIRKHINSLKASGAYLLFLGMDERMAESLVSDRLLNVIAWDEDALNYDPEDGQLFFNAATSWDPRAPEGKRAVTVTAVTDVEKWFTFHTDETQLEDQDQQMLETCWQRLHQAMPELGSSIEVIDTATPRTFYDLTRRKLGMVQGLPVTPERFSSNRPNYVTSVPNLFVVSDTTSPGGIDHLSRSALVLANQINQLTD